MTIPNALLVRWKHGYLEVIESGATDLVWDYLVLGSMAEDEAERAAERELVRLAAASDQIGLAADPDPAHADDGAFSGYTVGDYVLAPTRANPRITALDDRGYPVLGTGGKLTATAGAAARVMELAFAEDDRTRILSVHPTLSSLNDQRSVRMKRAIGRMIDGTIEGSSAVAQPIVTPEHVPARRAQTKTQTFSWPNEAILNYRSAPWTPEVNGRLAQMHLRRGRSSPEIAGDVSGALHVAIIVNGVTLDEGIIHDGAEESIFGGTGVAFGTADKLELQPTTVPAGTVSLTARVIQTHYH